MEGSDNNEEFLENEEPFIDDSEHKELVDDSCSTKVVGSVAPQDTFNIVYILFYFFGITSLMPWNFLMTANDYWMYKFRDTTPRNGSIHLGKTQFQAEFTSYLNVATALPNMLFLILNSLYGHHISVNIRIGGSLLIVTLSFLVTTAFVQVDTDDWQQDFFFITILIVVIMTAASAVVCGGICGIAGRFSAKYMTAVVSGQALGGIVAAVAQTLSLAFKVSPLHSALIYFVIGDIMLIVSLLSYFTLSGIEFYTYHMKRGYTGMASNRNRVVSYRTVIKKTWKYTFSMFMIFAVSTSVYPAVTVLIESHHSDKGTDWNNIYFVPVVNYLMFNCSDYAGRIIAGLVQRPVSKAWVVSWGSVVRALGIPLLMLCNAQPRQHLPVLIGSDWEYIIIMIVFGMSNGYLTNITFINCPKSVEPHEREKASSILAAVLSIGVTTGAALSMALVKIL